MYFPTRLKLEIAMSINKLSLNNHSPLDLTQENLLTFQNNFLQNKNNVNIYH